MTYKAYLQPFGHLKWLPENADVPYFGKLIGTCCDRHTCTYRLQPGANLADFLWAIGRAPWQLLDGCGKADVEVTVPPCENSGRPNEITRTFTVKGEKHHHPLGGKFGILIAALVISSSFVWAIRYFAELIGSKILCLVAPAASLSAISAIGGLLTGIVILLLIIAMYFFNGNGNKQQPKMRMG